jgi:hypothetical protein
MTSAIRRRSKGQLTHQKSVIPFVVDKKGPDSLHRFQFTGNVDETRTALEKSGLQYQTLIPAKGGTTAVVFDQGSELRENINRLKTEYAESIQSAEAWRGRGEFLGGDTRAQGNLAYQKVISRYEAANPNRRYDRAGRGQGLRDLLGTHPPEVKPLTAAEVLAEAARPKAVSYARFLKDNPTAGEGLFVTSPGRARAVQGPVERFVPPKGVSQRVQDATANPAVAAQLKAWARSGESVLERNWYDTAQLQDLYHGVLGPEKGQAAFKTFMQEVAATSPRNTVPNNIRTGSY